MGGCPYNPPGGVPCGSRRCAMLFWVKNVPENTCSNEEKERVGGLNPGHGGGIMVSTFTLRTSLR